MAKFCSQSCSGKQSSIKLKGTTRSKYTREALIERLREYAEELGRTPRCKEMTSPAGETYRRAFGSWTEAVAEAGLQQVTARYSGGYRLPIPFKLRFEVIKRDNFRCVYCGGTPDQGYTLEVDHIVPATRGGSDDIENLCTSCSFCNIGKFNTVLG